MGRAPQPDRDPRHHPAQQRAAGHVRAEEIDKVAINPNTLAVLQLRALQDLASSPNSKVVVPYAAAGLVGNAEMLVQALQGTTLPTPAPAAPASAAVDNGAGSY
jgi:hypothetical protein